MNEVLSVTPRTLSSSLTSIRLQKPSKISKVLLQYTCKLSIFHKLITFIRFYLESGLAKCEVCHSLWHPSELASRLHSHWQLQKSLTRFQVPLCFGIVTASPDSPIQ